MHFRNRSKNILIPRSTHNVQDFDIDLADTERLFAVSRCIGILARQLDDTVFLAGSEAYKHALAIYESAKGAAARNVPGAKVAELGLKARFPGRKQVKSDSEPAAAA
jgi:ethanolamine utilization microcompartment shell protein EutL